MFECQFTKWNVSFIVSSVLNPTEKIYKFIAVEELYVRHTVENHHL